MTQKILITGAGGQLGSEFRRLSVEYADCSFLFADVAELDVRDAGACMAYVRTHRPSLVVNCAAYTAVDRAEVERERAWLLNAVAVEHLRDACADQGAALMHISTDYVFDGMHHRPYSEGDAVRPRSEYGRSKEAGERAALAYGASMVVRTSWLYSQFGNNFMKTMLALGAERELLRVVFDQVGTPTLARDLARALLSVARGVAMGERPFVPGLYHFSNEGVCSWYDFACAIVRMGGLGCRVLPIESKDYPTPAHRPPFSVLNKAKIKATYGLEIPHWMDSLRETLGAMGFAGRG